MQKQLSETEKSIHNLLAAIEQGIFSKTTQTRLSELEAVKEKLSFEIESCKIHCPVLTQKHIVFMLSQFQRETSETLEEYNQDIIECFVNSVYLYNDKLIITYHLTDDIKKTECFHSVLTFPPDKTNNSVFLSGSDITSFGGGEGSRTPVRKFFLIAFYRFS